MRVFLAVWLHQDTMYVEIQQDYVCNTIAGRMQKRHPTGVEEGIHTQKSTHACVGSLVEITVLRRME